MTKLRKLGDYLKQQDFSQPTAGRLALAVLLVAAISITSLVLSVISLNAKVEDSQRDSLCRFYGYFVNLNPAPITPRGRDALEKALAEYRALRCTPPR